MNASLLLKRAAIGIGGVAVLTLLTGSIYESGMRRRALRDFPAPGRLVDVGGGRRIQIDCRGSGSPTVVLESGLDNYGSLAWAAVHDSIAATTRVCAYSRPGIMWSDPVSGPFDVSAQERDLHAALVASGESPPWVMVGHSLGGPFAMVFTGMYPADVAGVVLVDPSDPEQFPRFRRVAGKPMEPTATDVSIGAALAWTGLLRFLPNEPRPGVPAVVNRVPPAFLATSLAELARETRAVHEILSAESSAPALGDRPFIVLTATREHPAEILRLMGVTPEVGASLQRVSRGLHEREASWSTRGEHELVAGASHYIQFDRPDVVVAAIRRVVGATRLRPRRD